MGKNDFKFENKMKYVINCKIFSILILLIFNSSIYAVNVIAWWGYLDSTSINIVEKKCNTKISVDTYYSSDELLRRVENAKYSLAIFGSEVYNALKDKIVSDHNAFTAIKKQYHPNVLRLLYKQNFAKNSAIMTLNNTGILYNKNLLTVSKDTNLNDLFESAKGKKINFLDEPLESLKFVTHGKNVSDFSGTQTQKHSEEFKKLISGSSVLISNSNKEIIKYPDFAFSYTWACIGFKRVRDYPNLAYTSHPTLSFVSADLIALFSNDKETQCVAEHLASKSAVDKNAVEAFYFSPFGLPADLPKNEFWYEHKRILEDYDSLKWLEYPEKNQYVKVSNFWNKLKFGVNKK
ncbi:MAG: hypothetical protein DCC88_00665 [Spirobacillus cienkowskii]|jgi:hypothetical protein|uniref:Extracellular solute-binding protein n=1 Tax=Spirobacillus cienkowskii TaxID=495820 RepID=A0A369KRN4_9BACT|nr:MAG: hypothetical protein DCC88_00665 [Spirobacillus cienkowskii]